MYSETNYQKRAFTLIELLIVIAIILILIAIALPNFLEAQIRARVTNAKGALKAMDFAMNAHIIDWKCLPADFNDSNLLVSQCRVKGAGMFAATGACGRFPDTNFGTDGGLTFDGNVDRTRFYANNIHCPLTTPIPYLPADTTIDIFSDGTVPIGYDSRAIEGQIIYGAFFSAGPDRYAGHWLRFRADQPGDINLDGCGDALPYSATNGTTSSGEFWGVVGDWNHVIRGAGPCECAAKEYVTQKTY